MGRPDFGRSTVYPAPPVPHALHDDDDNVVDGDLAEAFDDGLPVELAIEPEPEPALPLGCRWRVPLTLCITHLVYSSYIEISWIHKLLIKCINIYRKSFHAYAKTKTLLKLKI